MKRYSEEERVGVPVRVGERVAVWLGVNVGLRVGVPVEVRSDYMFVVALGDSIIGEKVQSIPDILDS